ncbi:MAG: hypothetical protein Q9178_007659 [Gyalolechia marmorata]
MAFQTPTKATGQSGPKTTNKSATNPTDVEIMLDKWRIFLDHKEPMPDAVKDLVKVLKVPRDTEVTPNSKTVKSVKDSGHTWTEATEVVMLATTLLYRGKHYPQDAGGEPLVYLEFSPQWTAAVPRPPEFPDEVTLQALMAKYGSPPRPKPDVCFGYDDTALPGTLLDLYQGLPDNLQVHPKKPWFPYMLVQWKTEDGTARIAAQQIRRDVATAISTIYQFFKHRSAPGYEPSQADTCVFSLEVRADSFKYRVHWRRVADDGRVFYEGDVIAKAWFAEEDEIFRGRSVILKTLEWARGTRLVAIQKKLQDLLSAMKNSKSSKSSQSHPPPTPPSASGKQPKKAKSSHEVQESGDDHGFQEEL